jgi:hypothetical protein
MDIFFSERGGTVVPGDKIVNFGGLYGQTNLTYK